MHFTLIGQHNIATIEKVVSRRITGTRVNSFPTVHSFMSNIATIPTNTSRILLLEDGLSVDNYEQNIKDFCNLISSKFPARPVYILTFDLDMGKQMQEWIVSPFINVIYTKQLRPSTVLEFLSGEQKEVVKKYGVLTMMEETEYEGETIEEDRPKPKKASAGFFGKLRKKKPTEGGAKEGAEVETPQHDSSMGGFSSKGQADQLGLQGAFEPEVQAQEFVFVAKEGEQVHEGVTGAIQEPDVVQHHYTNPVETAQAVEQPYESGGVSDDPWKDVEIPSSWVEEQEEQAPTVVSDYTQPEEQSYEEDTQQEPYVEPIASEEEDIPLAENPFANITPVFTPKEEVLDGNSETVIEEQVEVHVEAEDFTTEAQFDLPQVEEVHSPDLGIPLLEQVSFEEDVPHTVSPFGDAEKEQEYSSQGLPSMVQATNHNLEHDYEPLAYEEEVEKPASVATPYYEEYVETVVEVEKTVERLVDVDVQGVTMPQLQAVELDESLETIVVNPVTRQQPQPHTNKMKTNDIIIVTGDRHSSVTTTAIQLSRMYAKAQDVLYVDLDIHRKGSITWLGLEEIISTISDTAGSSLRHLKNTTVLPSLTHFVDSMNMHVLITTYGEKIEEEDIILAQKTLSVQKDYSKVIIDCPLEHIHLLTEIIPYASVLITVPTTLRSCLATLEGLTTAQEMMHDRLALTFYKNASYVLTTQPDYNNFKNTMNYIQRLFEFHNDIYDWTALGVRGTVNNFAEWYMKV